MRWLRFFGGLLVMSVLSVACSVASSTPIGSIDVDDSALIWGDRPIDEVFSELRAVHGPIDDVNALVARIAPLVELPSVSDAEVLRFDSSLAVGCVGDFLFWVDTTCTDELQLFIILELRTSASVSELEALFVASPSFPQLQDDLESDASGWHAITTTDAGDTISIASREGESGTELGITQAFESIQDDLGMEQAGGPVAQFVSPESLLRNLRLNIEGGLPVLIMDVETPGETEEEARARSREARIAGGWTQDDSGYSGQFGDEPLSGFSQGQLFIGGILREKFTVFSEADSRAASAQ